MISQADINYTSLVTKVLEKGKLSSDRTGVGTRRIFCRQLRFPMWGANGTFPLLTTKYVKWENVVNEFIWMVVEGSTDVTRLEEIGSRFWNPWKGKDGTIGKGYGYQFRHSGGIDQVQNLIDGINENPYGRRHIIDLWNVWEIKEMALPPCHMMTQWFVEDGYVSCNLYQRSADIALGTPINWAFYALFVHVIAQLTDLKPGELIWTGGDIHIYNGHEEALKEQISRTPFPAPTLKINPRIDCIDDFTANDFTLTGYKHHPAIKFDVAV